jgi:hypothetical protein
VLKIDLGDDDEGGRRLIEVRVWRFGLEYGRGSEGGRIEGSASAVEVRRPTAIAVARCNLAPTIAGTIELRPFVCVVFACLRLQEENGSLSDIPPPPCARTVRHTLGATILAKFEANNRCLHNANEPPGIGFSKLRKSSSSSIPLVFVVAVSKRPGTYPSLQLVYIRVGTWLVSSTRGLEENAKAESSGRFCR